MYKLIVILKDWYEYFKKNKKNIVSKQNYIDF